MPDAFTCRACSDLAESCGAVPDCDSCEKEYEIFETVHGFWGAYVVVVKDGKFEKVPMCRVYDIKEVKE